MGIFRAIKIAIFIKLHKYSYIWLKEKKLTLNTHMCMYTILYYCEYVICTYAVTVVTDVTARLQFPSTS